MRQVSEVRHNSGNNDHNYRDQYMAENTAWYHQYFDEKKMALWGHNYHIANSAYGKGSMGHHLREEFGDDYVSVGFLFSRGSFTAVGVEGENSNGKGTHVIKTAPITNSINAVMSHAKEPVFSLNIAELEKHSEWNDAFGNRMKSLQIGATFNNNPEHYYFEYDPDYFDQIIYFDNTTASIPLF